MAKSKAYELIDYLKSLSEKNAHHIEILNGEHGETRDLVKELGHVVDGIKEVTIELKADMVWLKRFLWIIATASVGSLVAAVIQNVLK